MIVCIMTALTLKLLVLVVVLVVYSQLVSTTPLTTNGDAENPVISISPATTSSAGSMSAADKAKLDSLGGC